MLSAPRHPLSFSSGCAGERRCPQLKRDPLGSGGEISAMPKRKPKPTPIKLPKPPKPKPPEPWEPARLPEPWEPAKPPKPLS